MDVLDTVNAYFDMLAERATNHSAVDVINTARPVILTMVQIGINAVMEDMESVRNMKAGWLNDLHQVVVSESIQE